MTPLARRNSLYTQLHGVTDIPSFVRSFVRLNVSVLVAVSFIVDVDRRSVVCLFVGWFVQLLAVNGHTSHGPHSRHDMTRHGRSSGVCPSRNTCDLQHRRIIVAE